MKPAIITLMTFLLFCTQSSAQGSWSHITEIDDKPVGVVYNVVSAKGSIWITSAVPGNGYQTYRFDGMTWIDETDKAGTGFFVSDPKGNLWTWRDESLAKYDGNNWTFYEPGIKFQITGVDTYGNVWGYDIGNIYMYDGTNLSVYTEADGICQPYISRLVVSPEGDVWCRYGSPIWCDSDLACDHRGVSHFTDGRWETYDESSGLISNNVDDIAFGPDGSVYISYGDAPPAGGISRFDGTHWEYLTNEYHGMINFDSSGTLWAIWVWRGLLGSYNGNKWTKYEGMPEAVQQPYWGETAVDTDGRLWSGSQDGILIYNPNIPASIKDEENQSSFSLLLPYPNPFNASTTITYTLPTPSPVTLAVYAITGQQVATLVDKPMSAGTHTAVFDGSGLSSGLYFARIVAGGLHASEKLLLVK